MSRNNEEVVITPPPEGFDSWKAYRAYKKIHPSPPKVFKPEDHYVRLGIFKIEDVLPFYGPEEKEYMGEMVKMNSQRYELFKEKGCTCVKCGLVGTYFALERPGHISKAGVIHHLKYHFNLYGLNEKGEEVLFTKDHIHPRSKGGKSCLSNYQTMCSKCNWEKGNIVAGEKYIVNINSIGSPNEIIKSLESLLNKIRNNFNVTLSTTPENVSMYSIRQLPVSVDQK